MQETATKLNLQGKLRHQILATYKTANAGHIACSLSCIDLLIAAFIDNTKAEDTFVLYKGHAAVALYVSMLEKGELSKEEIATYYKNGTSLTAHPAPNRFACIPLATGSLGHGLPFGTGVAKATKLRKSCHSVIVLMSDGETNEGTTWEAAHFARQHKLDNLIVIIDKNKLQGFGNTSEVIGDTCSPEQWKALGFEVYETNGHDVAANSELISKLKTSTNGIPKVIIAHTTKGKGVKYMEDKLEWHYNPMNEEQFAMAMDDIQTSYTA